MSDPYKRLDDLHLLGHRSQHWFNKFREGSDRYVTFMLYEKDKKIVHYTGVGATFTDALVHCLEKWDAEHD